MKQINKVARIVSQLRFGIFIIAKKQTNKVAGLNFKLNAFFFFVFFFFFNFFLYLFQCKSCDSRYLSLSFKRMDGKIKFNARERKINAIIIECIDANFSISTFFSLQVSSYKRIYHLLRN